MTRHTKQVIIICIIILLVLCTIFAFRTDIQCLWWYVKCQTLEKDNRDYKLEVVKRLEEAKAIRILCWMLEDDDWGVRFAAACALGEVGDKRAVAPLIGVLKDAHKGVRYSVVYALGKLGDARAVEPLIAALKDTDRNVRRNAAGALGKLGDTRAIEPLCAAIRKDENGEANWDAAQALEDLGDTRAIGPLKKALAVEKDVFIRRRMKAVIEKLESVPDAPSARLRRIGGKSMPSPREEKKP